MHIAEGVLSLPVLIGGATCAIAGTTYGLGKLSMEAVPRCGVISASLFVASLIHVNVGVSSVHLLLNGLGGFILGWSLFPAYLVALLLQAILFQFGGLVVLGANATAMALPGVLAGLLGRWLMAKKKVSPFTAGFVAGSGGVLGASLTVAMALAFSGKTLQNSAAMLLAAHLPIVLIEGVVTGFIVSFIAKTMPRILCVPLIAFFVLTLLVASPASAHRINVFAFREGERVTGEVYFSDGTPAKGCPVRLLSADDEVLQECRTDDRGGFSLPLEEKREAVKVVVEDGVGHRTETTLRFSSGEKAITASEPKTAGTAQSSLPAGELEALMREAVRREVSPLREEVMRLNEKMSCPGFTEIAGGVGYIVGLVGVILWAGSRKKNG
ncbi:MAG: cobalt/nickel transport system permease protein [Synergistaceae bacterium]|jgi:cobalt/nickel transport system permease protein|nr:cobalt/nickel transport system permease protein [Synergistaceae bacterium]